MKGLSAIGLCVLAIAGIGGIGWLATENSYRLSAHYAPRYEDVRRTTFERSRTFQEGTIRDLDNLRLEYGRAGTDAQRQAIADTVRHRLADIDLKALPPETHDFVRQMVVGR